MRLTTPKLLLREFEGSDLSRPFPPGLSGPIPAVQSFDFRDPARVKEQIRFALEAAREEPRQVIDVAVILRETDQLIGRAGLQRSAAEPREALTWFITDPSTWNQGYLTEGAAAVLGHCFQQLGLHRVWAECDPKNAGAVRAMEKLGMRREAHFVENAWHGGEWRDTAVYALLDREWKP
jgi:ribosomal-protein-alanine N-acetyltransferase